MKHKESDLLCYLCGKTVDRDNYSDDHIPPKLFVPTSVRKEYYGKNKQRYIKVCSHKKCNGGWSANGDNVFRLFGLMATTQEVNSNADVRKQLFKYLVYKTSQKNGNAMGNTVSWAKKTINEFYEITVVDRQMNKNKVLPFKEEYSEVFFNIAKGIYMNEVGKPILYSNKVLQFGDINLNYNSELFELFKKLGGANDIKGNREWFCYKVIETDEFSSVWYILWDAFIFHVAFNKLLTTKMIHEGAE